MERTGHGARERVSDEERSAQRAAAAPPRTDEEPEEPRAAAASSAAGQDVEPPDGPGAREGSEGGVDGHQLAEPEVLGSRSLEGGNSMQVLGCKITAFETQRKEEKLRMFDKVMRVFLRTCVLGFALINGGAMMRLLLPAHLVLAESCLTVGFIVQVIALVMGSACPFELLDVDERFSKSRCLTLAFTAGTGLMAMAQVRLFPHIGALRVLVCVVGAMTTVKRLASVLPRMTSLGSTWICLDRIFWGVHHLFPEENNMIVNFPQVSYGLGVFGILEGSLLFGAWFWNRRVYAKSLGRRGVGPSGAVYQVFYMWCFLAAVNFAVRSGCNLLKPREGSTDALKGLFELVQGICIVTPPTTLLLVGRDKLFLFLGRKFDRQGARLRRDGAFISELLESVPLQADQLWWVHRDHDDDRYPQSDPRCKWQQGRITQVSQDSREFSVQLLPDGPQRWRTRSRSFGSGSNEVKYVGGRILQLPLPSAVTAKSKEELLMQAQKGLRCIEFTALTPELMLRVEARSTLENRAALYSLSRPVKPGEKIDFFMSNSWYDDAAKKWESLTEVAKSFYKRHNRYPTFWLDKTCIDQNAITDGLKVLPVNVMACSTLLCLCGDTYFSRLWCIWELFTLFAFVPEEAALERLKLVFLGDAHEGPEMLDRLTKFDVKEAHCYDPNEEQRLRQVIEAVGAAHFNKRISNVAAATRAQLARSSGRAAFSARSSWSLHES